MNFVHEVQVNILVMSRGVGSLLFSYTLVEWLFGFSNVLCIFHCIRKHQPCCSVCAWAFAVLLLFFIQEVKHLPLLFSGPVDSPLDLDERTQILPLLSVSIIRGFMLLICLMIQKEFLGVSTRSSWLFLAYRYVCEGVCMGLSLGLHLLTSDKV